MDLKRRTILGVGAIGSTSLLVEGAMRSPSANASEPLPADSAIHVVADRQALRQRQAIPGEVVYLAEAGRAGFFQGVSGTIGNDPLEGLSIPSAASRVHYARIWDGLCGRPEWFGAVVGDGKFDCAPPIEACYALCPVTELSNADYFIGRTLMLNAGFRTLRGVGSLAMDTGQGTRIVLSRHGRAVQTDDIVVVGQGARMGNDHARFPREIHLANFTLVRDGPCRPSLSGDVARYPAGLRANGMLFSTFDGIASLESSVGFNISGVVYTKFRDCHAQRISPGTGGGPDLGVGFYLDGRPQIGLAGGNASVYLERCLASEQHPRHLNATALLAQGAFVDTFVDHFECARIAHGIVVRVDGARRRGQSIDLHIRNAVLDACSGNGIDLDLNRTGTASVDIIDPYIHAAGGGGERGILVHGGAGLVTITGGQVHGAFKGGSLWFNRTRGARVQGVKIHEASRPVVLTTCSSLQVEVQICNIEQRAASFGVEASAINHCVIKPMLICEAGTALGGVDMDGLCARVHVDGSAIDPSNLPSGAASKIHFNGGDARASAAFRLNGNVMVGVPD